jgi:hypothetical protein
VPELIPEFIKESFRRAKRDQSANHFNPPGLKNQVRRSPITPFVFEPHGWFAFVNISILVGNIRQETNQMKGF